MASAKYEDGERALHEARQAQSEQQARLQAVQQQQERLRQQEQHMHQVRARPFGRCRPPAQPPEPPVLPPRLLPSQLMLSLWDCDRNN